MALVFPTSPNLNDTYLGWFWNGSAWKLSQAGAVAPRDLLGHYTYWCPASIGNYATPASIAADTWTTLTPLTPTAADERLTAMKTAAADPWVDANKTQFSLAGLSATGSASLAATVLFDFDQGHAEGEVRFAVTPNGGATFYLESEVIGQGKANSVFQAGSIDEPLTMSASLFGADKASAGQIVLQVRTSSTADVLIGSIDYRFFS